VVKPNLQNGFSDASSDELFFSRAVYSTAPSGAGGEARGEAVPNRVSSVLEGVIRFASMKGGAHPS
jgi:hypothetical protein